MMSVNEIRLLLTYNTKLGYIKVINRNRYSKINYKISNVSIYFSKKARNCYALSIETNRHRERALLYEHGYVV